jgi:hypothetical protein
MRVRTLFAIMLTAVAALATLLWYTKPLTAVVSSVEAELRQLSGAGAPVRLRRRNIGAPTIALASRLALHPARGGARGGGDVAVSPPDFIPSSPLYDISPALRCCEGGGVSAGAAHVAAGAASRWCSAHAQEAKGVCTARCAASEPNLGAQLEPWWDVKVPYALFHSICDGQAPRDGDNFITSIASMLFAVKDGKLYKRRCNNGYAPLDDRDEAGMSRSLEHAMGLAPVPDVVLAFRNGDTPGAEHHQPQIPVLTWDTSPEHWDLAWPTPFHRKIVSRSPQERFSSMPWHARSNKAYWRGALDGPWHAPPWSWSALWRHRLVRIASKHPELFDVGYTNVDENMYPGTGFSGPEQESKLGKLEAFVRPFVKAQEDEKHSSKFKYVINVDGVSAAWRVTALLSSGALLIKQESPYYEHFYPLMKPWVHFVPVRFDLQDLVQKVLWAREHETEVQTIVANAMQLSRTRLRQQDAQCYMWRALRSLSDLQDEMPTLDQLKSSGFVPVTASMSEDPDMKLRGF